MKPQIPVQIQVQVPKPSSSSIDTTEEIIYDIDRLILSPRQLVDAD